MRRQRFVVFAALLSSTALLAPTPVRANATTTCTEHQGNFCELNCPFDAIRDCNRTFRFIDCWTSEASCSRDFLCPDENSSSCCNMYTGTGCGGTAPFCALQHVYCTFI